MNTGEEASPRNRYYEETIYLKRQETLYDHSLAATLTLNQPWGTAMASLSGSAYLHDPSKNSLTLGNYVTFRMGRGFSLNLSWSYSRIRNQISLSNGGATEADILLRLKQLETTHTTSMSLGVSYTFGSIFNNVVNTRFSGASGTRGGATGY